MRRGGLFWTLALLAGAIAARPAVARADADATAIDPAGPHALGHVFTAGPTLTGPTLLVSGGYGYTESVLGNGDAHHRAVGALALHERPVPWLDLALRFDGRYDSHSLPGQPSDSGFVGDPRAYVRADLGFDGGVRLGARLGVWLPGRDAPSLDAGAISPELVGAISFVPREAPFALTLNAGYRVDRSAHSASDAARLSPADRLALGVSSFDAVLLGAAGTVGRGRLQGFVEGSWQMLVGAGHPSALASPILVDAGVRVALGPSLRLEAAAEVSPSRRPDVGPTAPLVPVPPRFAGWLGLCYRFGAAPPAPSPPPPAVEPSAPAPPPVAEPAPPATAALHGRVSAADGGKLTELRVSIAVGESRREAQVDDDGGFSFEGKPGDEVVVSAEAAGYLPAEAAATLAAGSPAALDMKMERRPPKGQLRGLVRSIKGGAVSAEVQVEPEGVPPGAPAGEPTVLRAAGGRFELDIAPGRYRVTISAHGYAIQRRQVEVEENGVTLLNVDLEAGAMNVSVRGAWVLVVAGLAGWASACRREPPVATLLEAVGTVERSDGAGWMGAAAGVGFAIGDTLRTGAASSARLRVSGGVIRIGENGRLRFQRGGAPAQQAPDIVVDLGSAEIEETVGALSLITPAGPARIQPGARVRVRADGQASSLEVLVGRAVIMEAGREVAIDAGQGVKIRIGSAELQRFDVKVGEAVVEGAPEPAQTPDAAPPKTVAERPAEGPADASGTTREAHGDTGHADVTITAGESATLHDGRPPLAVRLRFPDLCPGDAVVELTGHGHHRERVVGARAVVFRLKAGTHAYRVRCAGDGSRREPRATGVLSLRRDTGYVPLPRRAPANVIDADGRRYTILFQTRLPQLTLAWPKAPAGAAGLELHLESPAGARVLSVPHPDRPLPVGTFQEGTYTWWYTAGEGKQSPKTTVAIRFDNAAPTAQFFRVSSDAGSARPRGSIPVDGVTVEGAKVSVGGSPLPVDGRGRFRADVAPQSGDDAIAVRLELPRTGVHYYVRRRSDVR